MHRVNTHRHLDIRLETPGIPSSGPFMNKAVLDGIIHIPRTLVQSRRKEGT
jgi:hypothetical protein